MQRYMQRHIIAGMIAGIILALGGASRSDAQALWTQVASACTIDESDLADYNASGPYVYFKSAASGTIYLRCNITNPDDGGTSPFWNTLHVTYKDADGTSTSTRVIARLRRMTRSTGSVSTRATFDSNTFAGTGVQERDVQVSENWNFYNYYYYIEAYIYRASGTSGDVRVYGFALEQTLF